MAPTTSTSETLASETPKPETYTLSIDSAFGPVSYTVKNIPPREARPDEIPIIDISPILSPLTSPSESLPARLAIASQIRAACTTTGFFYLINHGIPPSVTTAAEAQCREFFHQSAEAKNRIYFDHEIEGYTGLNNEQINASESIDLREKFKLHYRPSLDPTSTDEGYPAGGTYSAFPWAQTSGVPGFEKAMTDCFTARLVLARKVLGVIALALELPEDYFEAKVRQPNAALVLNYYPPAPSGSNGVGREEGGPEQVGLGSHTDFGILTLLWQDDTGGLQILSPDKGEGGEWIYAKPIEGSLVCNMGDFMSMITNGRFVSDVHKAKNEGVGERISVPFFLGLGPREKIEVVDTCRDWKREGEGEGEKKVWEGMLAGEWLRKRQIDLKVAKLGKGGVPIPTS